MDFNGRELVPPADVAQVEDEDSAEEEEELALEEELAERGLYRGSYRRLIALYTFTPFTSILTLILLAFLPSLAFTSTPSTPRYSYVPYLPFPFPEIIVSTALWSLSHILRDAFFLFAALLAVPFGSYTPPLTTILSTIFQTVFSVFLQQISIPLLLITLSPAFSYPTWEDFAFRRVWWLALGWAAAEGIAGIKQGYEAIALYRDVLVIARRVTDSVPSRKPPNEQQNALILETEDSPRTITGLPSSSEQQYRIGLDTLALEEEEGERRPLLPRNGTGKYPSSDELRLEVERDLDQLIAIRNREELEEVYGMPMIRIPVFLSCLHRINSILISLGVFLLLSAAYLRSTLAPLPSGETSGDFEFRYPPRSSSSSSIPFKPTLHRTNRPIIITLTCVILVRLFLSFLHTTWILPRIGVHTFVYVSLMVSLGIFFLGLGVWEALI